MDQLQAVLIAELSQRVNQLQVALFAELSQRMDQLHATLISALRPPSQATQKNEPDDDESMKRAAENYGRPQTPERNNPVLPPTPGDTPYLNHIRPMMSRPAEVENPPVSNRDSVNDQSVQDPELLEDYRRLPNLQYYHPDLLLSIVPGNLSAIMIEDKNKFRRGIHILPGKTMIYTVDPRKLSALQTATSPERYRLQVDIGWGQFKDAVSSPGTSNSMEYKYLSGLLHAQEWEWMMATMCMAFDKTILQADLRSENIISFSMPPVKRGTTAGVPPNVVTYDKSIMDCGDEKISVPVYDATGLASLPLNEEYLDRLRFSTLPRWRKEISTGSCAIVAYRKIPGSNKWRLYTNIKWVIILWRSSN
ncbi:hypothetical protein BDQ17DRAFT_1335427 [Cyathus striatus]|nr:hypothetical protein BDQ17DRAFT_1335427 [Cyathus striatus]